MLGDSRQVSRQEVKPTRREPSMTSHTGGMRDNCQDISSCGTDSVDMLSSTVATVPGDISSLTYLIKYIHRVNTEHRTVRN